MNCVIWNTDIIYELCYLEHRYYRRCTHIESIVCTSGADMEVM